MKYFLETSVLVDYLQDKKVVADFVDSLEGELVSSYVCMAELYEGVARSRKPREDEKGLLTFFAGLSEVYAVDGEIARNFGQIRADLKKRGMVIEDLDIMIAATCVAKDLTLVTKNPRHFERVHSLDILTP